MGSQRVRHDLATFIFTLYIVYTFTLYTVYIYILILVQILFYVAYIITTTVIRISFRNRDVFLNRHSLVGPSGELLKGRKEVRMSVEEQLAVSLGQPSSHSLPSLPTWSGCEITLRNAHTRE